MADDNLAVSFEQAAPPETDFDAIHEAFVETERGRWFLIEYARRNRHADTALLLAAIGRIESILLAQRAASPEKLAAPANPSAIKPDDIIEGKSEAARLIGECTARLRSAIGPMREVAWSMREQGDMRCDVLDRQAVEIAQTCAAFDAFGQRLLQGEEPAAAAIEPSLPAQEAPAAELPPQAPPEPVAERPATAHAEPPPAQNFARADLLDALPARDIAPPAPVQLAPASESETQEQPAARLGEDLGFTFEELFDTASDAPEVDAHPAESAPDGAPISQSVVESEATQDAAFDSSQAQRLSRLISLFAGPRANEDSTTKAEVHAAAPGAPAESAAPVARARFVVTPEPEQPAPPPEPADFLLEPWPRVSAIEPAAPAPLPKSAPVAAAPAPPTKKTTHFPMPRPAPGDPLAPIVGLSVEEKIALFS